MPIIIGLIFNPHCLESRFAVGKYNVFFLSTLDGLTYNLLYGAAGVADVEKIKDAQYSPASIHRL